MLRVIGDKAEAVSEARLLSKTIPGIRLYVTSSGSLLLTEEDRPELREIPFNDVSIRAIREYDVEYMEEVPESERV